MPKPPRHHVCPAWIGWLLASPIRKLLQNPEEILAPHVTPGMRVLEVGPGMGFFTLPLARLVGPTGRVICVDIQEKMLRALKRRAQRAGLADRVEARICDEKSLRVNDLALSIDLVLAFAVVHEIGDADRFFREARSVLKPHGRILFAEPKDHVSEEVFQESLSAAEHHSLQKLTPLKIARSRAALLEV